jgi:hypothetical protein
VRTKISPFHFALPVLCAMILFGLPALGQDKDRDEKNDHPNGIVQDWSRRHVVYPRFGSIESLTAVQHDPRAILSWQAAEREDWHRERNRRHRHEVQSELHRDWAISLSPSASNVIPPAMYPAKFGFNPNATPSCADFAVFPVSIAGSATQPNIVAFSNLYSGGSKGIVADYTIGSTTVSPIRVGTVTAADIGQPISGAGIPPNDTIATVIGNPVTGLTMTIAATTTNSFVSLTVGSTTNAVGDCNGRAPQGTVDNPLQATTMWSYDINAAGGQVTTSPSLSFDATGSKVAFVESVAGTSTHFHVLAWKSGDGVDAANAQNVLLPKQINSFTDPLAPAAGTGTASDLSLGSTGDTLSSPFVDLTNDVAYVGNDAGVLFRVKNVFCTLPACAGASPSLDLSWNSTGSVTIGGSCTGQLTGAVVDTLTSHVFVGCADGKLYGFTSTGAPLATASIAVGDGTATGGIVDPPLIDTINRFVYAASGSSAGSSVLVQASTVDLSGKVTATLGVGGVFKEHAPAFNAAYFSSGTPGDWLIYNWATNSVNQVAVYGVGFGAGHVMTAGAAANVFPVVGSTGDELSPVTEYLNGATDQLIVSGLAADDPNIVEFNINTFPTVFPPINGSNATGATLAEGGGTSGIIVDNDSGLGQASSFYFGALSTLGVGVNANGNSAVKLTQTGLL